MKFKHAKTLIAVMVASISGQAPAAIPGLPAIVEAQTSCAEVIIYDMPGVKDPRIQATAMLLIPKANPSGGGYNLIAWAHGTSGQAAPFAPTEMLKHGGPWESDHDQNAQHIAWLLGNGFAVVAPDYEGLGPRSVVPNYGHPYYNRSSLGKSMAYAVVAVRHRLGDQLSGDWAADGLSEGGMAALSAASESSAATGVGMNFKGTVAVAPVLRIQRNGQVTWEQIRQANQYSQDQADIDRLVFMNAELPYLIKSANLVGYNVEPSDLFRTRMLERFKDDKSLDDDNKEINDEIRAHQARGGKLLAWPGALPGEFSFELYRFLVDNQGYFEQNKLPGKVLFIQGDKDLTTPIQNARDAAAGMARAGTDVKYVELKNVGHYDAPTAARSQIQEFYQQIFLPLKPAQCLCSVGFCKPTGTDKEGAGSCN